MIYFSLSTHYCSPRHMRIEWHTPTCYHPVQHQKASYKTVQSALGSAFQHLRPVQVCTELLATLYTPRLPVRKQVSHELCAIIRMNAPHPVKSRCVNLRFPKNNSANNKCCNIRLVPNMTNCTVSRSLISYSDNVYTTTCRPSEPGMSTISRMQ